MARPKPLSFKEWREMMLSQTDDAAIVECKNYICECSWGGDITFGAMCREGRDSLFLEREYEDELRHDIAKLAEYQNEEKLEVYVDYGYTVYCDLNSKEEVIRRERV